MPPRQRRMVLKTPSSPLRRRLQTVRRDPRPLPAWAEIGDASSQMSESRAPECSPGRVEINRLGLASHGYFGVHGFGLNSRRVDSTVFAGFRVQLRVQNRDFTLRYKVDSREMRACWA